MLTYLVIEIRIVGEVREVYVKISDHVAIITFLTLIPRLWVYAGHYFGTSEQCRYYKHCNGFHKQWHFKNICIRKSLYSHTDD
jgi:hypothetical protein